MLGMSAHVVIPVLASILILGVLGSTENAFAATITVFNDFASFDAATGLLTEEDFEGLTICDPGPFFPTTCTTPLVVGDAVFSEEPDGVFVTFCGGCGSTGIFVTAATSTTIVEFPTGPQGVLLMFNARTTSFSVVVTDLDGDTLIFSGASLPNFPNETPVGFTSNAGIQKIEFLDLEFIGRMFLSLPPSDLSITKIDSPDPVTAGNQLTYTLTVNNAGPGDAQNVLVSDTLPSGVTLVSVSSSQGGCAALPCNLGTITSGGSATVTINVTVDLGTTGTLTNTASVTSDSVDPDNSNNTATEDTTSEGGVPEDPQPTEDPGPPEDPGPTEDPQPPEEPGPPEKPGRPPGTGRP